MQFQAFLPYLLTIFGAGISAWITIRVSSAETRRDIKALERANEMLQRTIENQHADLLDRVRRLEQEYFKK